MRQQCELLSINRSTIYYRDKPPTLQEANLTNEIRDVWLRYPFYGYRRITKELQFRGFKVNAKRVLRLMKDTEIKAIYPGPNNSRRNHKEAVYPYELRDKAIAMPNQAWMVDITYLRLP